MTVPALAVLGRGLVDPAEPVLRADDLGVLRGDGIFETVRVRAGRAVLLKEHLVRMRSGAARLDLPIPAESDWQELAADAVRASGAGDGVLKLLATRGPEEGDPVAYALVTPIPERTVRGREQGVHVVTLAVPVHPGEPWLLRGIKTTSYAVNMASLREAEARGADDAIWVAVDGTLLEAPTSNVVWVSGGRAATPPSEAGLLRGVTLAALRTVAEVDERPGTLDELLGADEVMLTSSVRGVAPVLSIDGKPVGDGTVGPVTAAMRRAYEEL